MEPEFIVLYAFLAVIIVLGIRRYRIWKDEDFGDRDD
jgi:ABC-type multidrug transport system permease subunit